MCDTAMCDELCTEDAHDHEMRVGKLVTVFLAMTVIRALLTFQRPSLPEKELNSQLTVLAVLESVSCDDMNNIFNLSWAIFRQAVSLGVL